MQKRRWPHWVYGTGTDPDPRFSFANERTFLAWLRTALALVAGAVALDAFAVPLQQDLKQIVVVALLLLGAVCGGASWIRWAKAERAMRRAEPLPSSPLAPVLTVGLLAVTVLLLVALW